MVAFFLAASGSTHLTPLSEPRDTLYALCTSSQPPGVSMFPQMAIRSTAARFKAMALMFWSNARPHWMAELLPEANRRADPMTSSTGIWQISAARSAVHSCTCSAMTSKPVVHFSTNS